MGVGRRGIRGVLRAAVLGGSVAVASTSSAQDEVPSVVTESSSGARFDWTHLRLELEASAKHPIFRHDLSFAEQAAMEEVVSRLVTVIEDTPLRDALLGAAVPELAGRVRSLWSVVESRYHRGGVVEVVGAVDLSAALESWMASRTVEPPLEEAEVRHTGVLLDARGTSATPCYAPRVLDDGGAILYDGALWHDVAGGTPPARWVTTPAHPVAARTLGAQPQILKVGAAEGCTLILSPEVAAVWAKEVGDTRLHGEGRVVVVVEGATRPPCEDRRTTGGAQKAAECR